MIHVSTSCNPNSTRSGALPQRRHRVFMQLLAADLFEKFPALTFVIPHGAERCLPLGRYRGLAARWQARSHELLRNVYFDTCVYHQPGIDLLHRVIPWRTSCSPPRCSARCEARPRYRSGLG